MSIKFRPGTGSDPKCSLMLFGFLLLVLHPSVVGSTDQPREPRINVLAKQARPHSGPSSANELRNRLNVRFRNRFTNVLNGFSGTVPAAHLQTFLRQKTLQRIQLNRPVDPQNRQSSPENFTKQTSPSKNATHSVKAIGANRVNTEALPMEEINVAVIDSKVDEDHPFLEGQITHKPQQSKFHPVSILKLIESPLRALWYLRARKGTKIGEPDFHGTAIAGLVGGRPSPEHGQFSIAPGTDVFDVTVIPDTDKYTPYIGDIVDGLDSVAELQERGKEIHAVNMSIALPSFVSDMNYMALLLPGWSSFFLSTATDHVVNEHNIPVVAASGNFNENVDRFWYNWDPAAYPETISVSALQTEPGSKPRFASFSNYGALVDVAAPTEAKTTDVDTRDMRIFGGTSCATAITTGSVALMQAQARANNLDPSPGAMKHILKQTGQKPKSHWKGIDAFKPTEPLVQLDDAIQFLKQAKALFTIEESGKTVRLTKKQWKSLRTKAQKTKTTQTISLDGGTRTEEHLWGIFGTTTYEYSVKVQVKPNGDIQSDIQRNETE